MKPAVVRVEILAASGVATGVPAAGARARVRPRQARVRIGLRP